MELKDKVVVITGGGSGIGRAVARIFANEGARIAIGDRSPEFAKNTANEIGGIGIECDVVSEEQIKALISRTEQEIGPVDLFFSNAGLVRGECGHAASASDDDWQANWQIHVMAHVYAARALLPGMIERESGYLLNMASAAGLLSQIGDAAYTATKHAAVAFAESLAITHGDQGIKVSVVCPQYVATPLIGYDLDNPQPRNEGTITPEQAAQAILNGVKDERFLILTHPEVATYYQHRAGDPDRWLSGMRRLRQNIIDAVGGTGSEEMRKFL